MTRDAIGLSGCIQVACASRGPSVPAAAPIFPSLMNGALHITCKVHLKELAIPLALCGISFRNAITLTNLKLRSRLQFPSTFSLFRGKLYSVTMNRAIFQSPP